MCMSLWQGPNVCCLEEVGPHLPQGKQLQLQKEPLLRRKDAIPERNNIFVLFGQTSSQCKHLAKMGGQNMIGCVTLLMLENYF